MDRRYLLHSAHRFVTRAAVVYGLYVALAGGAVLSQWLKTAAHPHNPYPHYNEYLILKSAFGHLRQHHNLYAWSLTEHWDRYKYSPTFAVGFAPLTCVPDWLGMLLWNLLNALALCGAVYALPGLTAAVQAAILGVAALPLVVSLQHFQSNGLMAALMILSVALRLREHLLLATLCLVGSLFVKLFGVCAGVVFVVLPHRRRALLCTLLWVVVLAALPLAWISVTELARQYAHWLTLLQEDHTMADGLSVMRGLRQWFGIAGHNTLIQVLGVGLLCLPLLNRTAYDQWAFRIGLLSAVLMWVVLFNHRAETATLVIAVCGCALGYATSRRTALDTGLLVAVVLVTCLAPTDLWPLWLRQGVFKPYALAVVPVIGMWLKRTADLLGRAGTTA